MKDKAVYLKSDVVPWGNKDDIALSAYNSAVIKKMFKLIYS